MAAKRKITEQIFGAEEHSAAKMDPEKLGRFQRIAARMFNTPQLSAVEVGTPAVSKAGRQISDMINDTYRTFYFVSVLRLDMVYVTLILTLTGIFNTLIRPLMGIVYDKTRTRWGKARPYAIFAPAMYFAATALLFCGRLFFDNDVTDDPRKIIFVFCMLIIRDIFSLIYKVPVDNYLTLMTPNPEDRMKVGLWDTYARKWSGDFLAALIMPLLDLARSGKVNLSPGTIFAGFGIVAAFIGTGGGMLLALNCRERIMLQPKPAPVTKTLFYILKNKYMMRNFIADMASNWWSSGGYTWDVVTQLEIFGGAIRGAPFYIPRQLVGILSITFVERFKKFFGGSYRKTVILMRIWDFIAKMVPAIFGLATNAVSTWWKAGLIFAVFDGINVANDAPSTVLEGELNRRIDDYTEYVTGERPDGSIGILTQLVGKVTEPLKALVTIAVFKWSGYDPNIAGNKRWNQERVRENASMYSRVFFLYNLANVVSFVFHMIPLIFYDIEGRKMEEMYTALNERRALIANESTMPDEMAAMIEMMAEEETAKVDA